MKFMMIVFFGIGLSFSSCHENKSKKLEFYKPYSDSVLQTMPEWYRAGSFMQRMDEKLLVLLNLKSLRNGFDGLQIRILVDCGHNKPSSLIILEKKGLEWNAVFYSFVKVYFNFESGGNMDFKIRDIHIENRSPKSGWKVFSEHFFKTGFMELEDISKNPEYSDGTDGDCVTVEIGTKKSYSLLHFPSLGWNAHIKGSPENLNKALSLIETEFNYKRPCEQSEEVN